MNGSALPYIELVVFFVFFGISFYCLSAVQYEKFCKVQNPMKIYVLLFMLSLIMAYLAKQAVLSLTVYNGL